MKKPDNWKLASVCTLNSLECIFEPMTSCDYWHLEPNENLTLPGLLPAEKRVVYFERLVWQKIGYFNGWAGFDSNPTIDQVPEKYRRV